MTKFRKPKDSCSKSVQLLHTAAAVLDTSTATLAFKFSWLHYWSQCTLSVNSKLRKLARAFSHVTIIKIFNNRLLFTKHGFHLSKVGKELLVNQVALHILSLLEKDNSKPITLGWCHEEAQDNATLTPEPPQIHKN
jgi:hypothetical protein